MISGHLDVINISHLVLKLLLAPDDISDSDIEQLVRLIIYVWQHRLGIDLKKAKYVDGELLYECKIPRWFFEPEKYGLDMQVVRFKPATCLAPCLKDEFMTKFEWSKKQLEEVRSQFIHYEVKLPEI